MKAVMTGVYHTLEHMPFASTSGGERAEINDYISKFDVHQGKTDTSSRDSEDNGTEQEFGLGEQVVQTMTKDLLGK